MIGTFFATRLLPDALQDERRSFVQFWGQPPRRNAPPQLVLVVTDEADTNELHGMPWWTGADEANTRVVMFLRAFVRDDRTLEVDCLQHGRRFWKLASRQRDVFRRLGVYLLEQACLAAVEMGCHTVLMPTSEDVFRRAVVSEIAKSTRDTIVMLYDATPIRLGFEPAMGMRSLRVAFQSAFSPDSKRWAVHPVAMRPGQNEPSSTSPIADLYNEAARLGAEATRLAREMFLDAWRRWEEVAGDDPRCERVTLSDWRKEQVKRVLEKLDGVRSGKEMYLGEYDVEMVEWMITHARESCDEKANKILGEVETEVLF